MLERFYTGIGRDEVVNSVVQGRAVTRTMAVNRALGFAAGNCMGSGAARIVGEDAGATVGDMSVWGLDPDVSRS